MTQIIIILGLVATIAGIALYIQAKGIRLGRNEQKLENAKETIGNVQKAKGAISRLNDDIIGKLREKYRK